MYGKIFESMFSGSMYGAGPTVFAVWSFVIATARLDKDKIQGTVELNPQMLAAILGTTEKEICKAITYLCQPDPRSRSKDEDGRRLVLEDAFQYRVPTLGKYHAIRNEEERREYMRNYMAKKRM